MGIGVSIHAPCPSLSSSRNASRIVISATQSFINFKIPTDVVDHVERIDHELVSVSCLPPWQDRETLKDVQAYVVALLNYRDLLAEQLPGKSVITSDHRNAIGEWATPFPIPVYFHPSDIRTPVLNDVLWFVPPYSERKAIVRSDDTVSG